MRSHRTLDFIQVTKKVTKKLGITETKTVQEQEQTYNKRRIKK